MDPRQVALLRRKGAESRPAVLVVDALSPDELKQLVGSQVRRILRLSTLTAESLAEAVTDAAGSSGTTVLEHELRDQLKRHQLAGEEASADGLTDREMSVLRLVAEGYDNNEIAQELHFSVRTVKKVLFGFGQRQGLRNRTQMIAHAIRRGFI